MNMTCHRYRLCYLSIFNVVHGGFFSEVSVQTRLDAYYKMSLLFAPICFAIMGMLTRLHVQDVESRFQIALFWLGALALELVVGSPLRSWQGRLRLALDGTAATIAIVATKWVIEGLPPLLYR